MLQNELRQEAALSYSGVIRFVNLSVPSIPWSECLTLYINTGTTHVRLVLEDIKENFFIYAESIRSRFRYAQNIFVEFAFTHSYFIHRLIKIIDLAAACNNLLICLCFRSLDSHNRTITEPTSRLSDDPFVTCDDNLSTNTSTPTSLKKQDSFDSPLKDVGYKKRNSKQLPLRNDGTLDYDGELIDECWLMKYSRDFIHEPLQQFMRMNLTTTYRWNLTAPLWRISCLRWRSAWISPRLYCPLSSWSVARCSKCTPTTLPIRICSFASPISRIHVIGWCKSWDGICQRITLAAKVPLPKNRTIPLLVKYSDAIGTFLSSVS